MATGSKRGRKPSTSSKKTTSRNTKSKRVNKNQSSGVVDEVIVFIALGVAVLLFLGTCGLLGSFGEIIRKVLIGLFGMIGFVFPVIFFLACTFSISNKWEKVTKVRLITSIVFLLDLASFVQLIFARDVYINKLTDYFTDSAKNGGFLGGIITHFLCKFLGMAGTIVILIVVFIICVVLLTDRSLFTSVREGSKILSDDFKSKKAYRKEISEIHSMEREAREMEHWEKKREQAQRRREIQEEKRALELEKRRKKAEEKQKIASENMLFYRTDLKSPVNGFNQPNDIEDLQEQIFDNQHYEEDNDYYEESSEVDALDSSDLSNNYSNEPESMFYGRASSWGGTAAMPDTQAIIKSTSDAIAINEAGNNLFNATKLGNVTVNGDMTELSDMNYSPDDDFVEYINRNLNTAHKISVDVAEEALKQEAYERDVYVDDSASFNEDYEDVANLFANRRNRIAGGHHINIANNSEAVDDTSYQAEQEEYTDYYNDLKDDEFNPVIEDEDEINISENEDYEEISRPSATLAKSISDIDLSVENAKPAPVSQVVSQGKSVKAKRTGKYKLPPVTLLNEIKNNNSAKSAQDELKETSEELRKTLEDFGLKVQIIGSSRGPAVTRYEIQMPTGVSVKKITNLSDDIMMSLGAKDIRIEAPIPGKKAVGIELPNKESTMVHFRELIDSKSFKGFESKVAFGVGKDLSGDIVVTDIAKMPHLLIAGATGSGKSVCINTLIMSILFKARPDEVKLIMIDPKMVELSIYNNIPHLLIPVVTEPKKASAALSWAVNEMTVRYQKFAEVGVRDMKGYNSKIQTDPSYIDNPSHSYMPQIVIVVDELADLMMVAAKEVEESICRLAQLARAAGIYLILATQRPSVDVITGLIKANMPSRIAFSVSSGVDSRTILDMFGAEKLLGNGDMLFFPRGYNKPARVQGAFVSDDEVQRVVDYIRDQSGGDSYDEAAMNIVNAGGANTAGGSAGLVDPQGAYDELFTIAGHAVIESDKASIGMLQRKFKIGFNRAARIMDQLSDEGVVGPEEGTKPRKILMTMEQFNQMLEEKNHQ